MYLDIPQLTRCCFCLPLRHGVLLFGYLNLAFSILVTGVLSYLYHIGRPETDVLYRGNIFFANAACLLVIVLLDVVFNVLLVVAGHMKSIRLLRVYFYYCISTNIAAILLNFTFLYSSTMYPEELCILFSGFVLQVYLLILVRSEIIKLEKDQPVQYVNQLTNIIIRNDQPQSDQLSLIHKGVDDEHYDV